MAGDAVAEVDQAVSGGDATAAAAAGAGAAAAGAETANETVADASAVEPAAGGAAPAADLEQGQTVYQGKCQACHATGAAGAPKNGDKANWAPRIAQGMDTLNKHAIEGFKGAVGYMPPKGGFTALSDDEVKAAVAYMVSQSQ
ncbi:MAG: c-type cytochrome [Gammaproteobacteria bacterium]|nr:c-type cytochrome [Gammaproteobacteria bacterium]